MSCLFNALYKPQELLLKYVPFLPSICLTVEPLRFLNIITRINNYCIINIILIQMYQFTLQHAKYQYSDMSKECSNWLNVKQALLLRYTSYISAQLIHFILNIWRSRACDEAHINLIYLTLKVWLCECLPTLLRNRTFSSYFSVRSLGTLSHVLFETKGELHTYLQS